MNSSTDIQSQQWHHIALVLSTTATITTPQNNAFTVYLDGQWVGSLPASPLSAHINAIGMGATNDVTLFHNSSGTTGNYLSGKLDEFFRVNAALSLAEIKALAYAGQPVLALDFDESFVINQDTLYDDTDLGQTVQLTSNEETNKIVDGIVGGYAMAFDGNDYLLISDTNHLDFSHGQFTQMAWVYPSPDDTDTFHGIMGYYSGVCCTTRSPSLYIHNQTGLHGGFGDGTDTNTFIVANVLTENAWNHIAVTFDGTTYKAYVDGIEVYSDTSFAGKVPYYNPQYEIGRVGNSYFEGRLDEVRLYPRALSAAEINSHYHAAWQTADPFPTSAKLTMHLNEATDSITFNSVDSLYTATCTPSSGSGQGNCPTAGFDGIVGTALQFDSTNSEYLTFGDNDDFDFGAGSFSVAAWVNQADATNWRNIVVKKEGANVAAGWNLRISPNNKTQFFVGNGTDYWVAIDPNVVPANEWHHLAGVLDSDADAIYLYVDGVLVASQTSISGSFSSNADMMVGYWNTGANSLDGLIDEVNVFAYALSPEQVQTLMNQKQGNWAYTIPQQEGLYSLNSRSRDNLDNIAAPTELWSGLIDTQAPQIDLTATISGTEAIYSYTTLEICDKVASADNGWYNQAMLAFTPANYGDTIGGWRYQLPISGKLDNVSHALSITAIDSVGNRTSNSIEAVVRVDNVPPVISVTGILTPFHSISATTVSIEDKTPTQVHTNNHTIAGSVGDGSPLQSLVLLVKAPFQSVQTIALPPNRGAWSYDLSTIETGTYHVWVRAVDEAGNIKQVGDYKFVRPAADNYTLYLPIVMK